MDRGWTIRPALGWSAIGVVALAIAAFLGADEQLTLEDLAPPKPSTALEQSPPPLQLRDVTLGLGISATHEQTSEMLSSMRESLGGGVCALDVNRDGWIDLFLVGGSGHTRHYGRASWWEEVGGNRLLINRNGTRFEDVTDAAGLRGALWGMGCAAGDLDNDGFVDLVVVGVEGNQLLRNGGDSTFRDVTADAGLHADHWSTGASLADFNGDGLLDIYVSNFVLYREGARTFERSTGFKATNEAGFDPTLYDPEPNRLYVNRGGLRFEDVAPALGVSNAFGRSLGAKWFDINGDAWPDLLVVNDQGTPNQLFINERGRNFSRSAAGYSTLEIPGAHDVVLADFDRDGRREVFMSRGAGRAPVLLSPALDWGAASDQAWSRNLGQTQLLPFSGWGAVAADFNNDGATDLFLARGSTTPDLDAPLLSQAQPNTLFVNDGTGRFAAETLNDPRSRPLSSRGAIAVDLDNDGALEVVVSNNNDVLQVFSSQSVTGNWLMLDLRLSTHDAPAYGAVVTLHAGPLTLTRHADVPQGFLSQGDRRLHFGLGGQSTIESLRVVWPDGEVAEFRDVQPNRILSLRQGSRSLVPRERTVVGPSPIARAIQEVDDEALVGVARLLLDAPAGEVEPDIDALEALWERGGPEVRTTLIGKLPTAPSPRQMDLIRRGLVDTSADVRSEAIERLRSAELEQSIPWLLPRLGDVEPKVQCETAESFRHFFDEEEAVPKHESLSVPPLIRLLQDDDASARRCAAAALAASEKQRAVLPLLDTLKNDVDAATRAEAARALGLIRDTRASAPLTAVVDAGAEEPQVLAASFIALSRLDCPGIEERLLRWLGVGVQSPKEPSDLERRLLVLSTLSSDDDGAVFSKQTLGDALERTVPRNLRSSPARVAVAALRAIGAARRDSLRPVVHSALSHADLSVRIDALLALTTFPAEADAVDRELTKQPGAVIAGLLKALDGSHALTPRSYARLYFDASTRAAALELLPQAPPAVVAAAVDSMLESTSAEAELLPLLHECAGSKLTMPWPRVDVVSRWGEATQAVYATCLVSSNPRPVGTRLESQPPLAVSVLLQAIRAEPAITTKVKDAALLFAARRDTTVARTQLAPRLESVPNEDLSSALEALWSPDTLPSASGFLWKVLEDRRRPARLRVEVARLLAQVDRGRATALFFDIPTEGSAP